MVQRNQRAFATDSITQRARIRDADERLPVRIDDARPAEDDWARDGRCIGQEESRCTV